MKNSITILLLITFLGWNPVAGYAQDSLSKRLSKLENIFEKLPKISGYLDFRYRYQDGTKDDINTFDVRRVRVNLMGEVTPKFDYRIQADLAGSFTLLDAYIRWKPLPYLNLQAGQFKIPFSIENPYSPLTLETIEYSIAITELAGYQDISGVSSSGRGIGIALYGSFLKRGGFDRIEYIVALLNGNEINHVDDNNSKDFSGKIFFHLTPHLSFSTSHYNGCAGSRSKSKTRIRTAVGITYEDSKTAFRSEYIWGKTGFLNSEGGYALAGYRFFPKFQGVLKYDYFKRDRSCHIGQRADYLIGINYQPVKQILLQLDYTYKTYKDARNSNFIAAQLYTIF